MLSQSLFTYSLQSCVVSAAQFSGGGELTFYSDHSEVIANDGCGQSTTCLSIEFTSIAHFRVIKADRLLRITVPHSTVQMWAQENGFASQVINESNDEASSNSKYCNLFLELVSDSDMGHFLSFTAPMVAANRQTRSASRLSVTEPLPVSFGGMPDPSMSEREEESFVDSSSEMSERGSNVASHVSAAQECRPLVEESDKIVSNPKANVTTCETYSEQLATLAEMTESAAHNAKDNFHISLPTQNVSRIMANPTHSEISNGVLDATSIKGKKPPNKSKVAHLCASEAGSSKHCVLDSPKVKTNFSDAVSVKITPNVIRNCDVDTDSDDSDFCLGAILENKSETKKEEPNPQKSRIVPTVSPNRGGLNNNISGTQHIFSNFMDEDVSAIYFRGQGRGRGRGRGRPSGPPGKRRSPPTKRPRVSKVKSLPAPKAPQRPIAVKSSTFYGLTVPDVKAESCTPKFRSIPNDNNKLEDSPPEAAAPVTNAPKKMATEATPLKEAALEFVNDIPKMTYVKEKTQTVNVSSMEEKMKQVMRYVNGIHRSLTTLIEYEEDLRNTLVLMVDGRQI